jgi:hypothetical protein
MDRRAWLPGRLGRFVAFATVVSEEMRGHGILTVKGEQRGGTRLLYWLTVAGVAALPVWSGESVAFLVPVIGIGAVWLLAAGQLSSAIRGTDLTALQGRLPVLVLRVVEELRKRHVQLPTMSAEEEQEAWRLAPALLGQIPGLAVLPLLARLSLRAGVMITEALVGLLVGPILERIHFGYWSPASIVFGLVFPSAIVIVAVVAIGVVTTAYLAAIDASGAVDQLTSPGSDETSKADS